MDDRPIESAVLELRFQIDRVPDQRRSPEQSFSVHLSVSAFEDSSLQGEPLRIEGTISRHGTEVNVFSRIDYALNVTCVRCLEEFCARGTVSEYAHFLHRKLGGATYPEHEQYGDSGLIDLVPWVREIVLTDLPEYPLCSEACAGLCSECGENIQKGLCHCPRPG